MILIYTHIYPRHPNTICEGIWKIRTLQTYTQKTLGGGFGCLSRMWLKESKEILPWHGWGSEGPFDVILGFSEGASCAAVLLAAIQGVSRILEQRNHTTTAKTQPFCPSHTSIIKVVWFDWFGTYCLEYMIWIVKHGKNTSVFRMKPKWLRSHWL